MNKVKVSLIMPVYNSDKYLKDTLDSIINQTFKEFELIAIDDGSNDNSVNILNEYQVRDNRIRVIRQNNSGVSKTRNKGISLAKGEYIGFVDADDLLEKDFLKILYQLAKEKNADISMTGYSIFYKNNSSNLKKYVSKDIEFKDKSRLFEDLLDYGIGVNIWTKLYKKSFIDKYEIKFIENMSYDEDMFFSWKCALVASNICFDNNCRYFYRLSPESATMKYHHDMYKKYQDAFEEIRDFANKYNIYSDYLEKDICINFARKTNVILTMIVRSSLIIKEKMICIDKVLSDSIIQEGINELAKLYEIEGRKDYLIKDIQNKRIISLIIKIYLIDIKIKIARKVKKYLRK